MKYHVIDNSLKNLGKAVLWQYDRATRLLALLKYIQVLYHCAVEQFWSFWLNKVLAIDTCGPLGCSLWGIFLGVARPTVVDADGTSRLVATSVYRRLLKGAFYLMKSTCSFSDILGYIEIVFGIGGDENLSKWNVYVSEYGWTTNVDELNGAYVSGKAYSKDDVVWYHQGEHDLGSNWKFTRDVSAEENTSWEDIADAREETSEEPTGSENDDILLLKLYDPEGICRKIGGSPLGALSISLTYNFGNISIYAEATRRRKCGITITDNEDMSITYGKSQYYNEMHSDQKAIFEQRMDEFCPFPLGIKTNEPPPECIFGFKGQENEQYEAGRAYDGGDIFGYVDEKGKSQNYKCKAYIPENVNTSFEEIQDRVEKTTEGNPYVCGLVDYIPPYNTNYYAQIMFRSGKKPELNWVIRLVAPLSIPFEYRPGTTYDTIPIPVISIVDNSLVVGTVNGIDYVYRAQRGDNYRIEYSDGERFSAIAYAREERNNFIGVDGYFLNNIALTTISLIDNSKYLSYNGSSIIRDDRFMMQYDISYAIGQIAEKYGWQRVGYAQTKEPMEGTSYIHYSQFTVDGIEYVDYPEDVRNQTGHILIPCAQTTLISSATQKRLTI